MTRAPLLALFLLLGCGDHTDAAHGHDHEPAAASHEHPNAEPAHAEGRAAAEARAREAMQHFGKQLKGTLVATMKAEGPAAAVRVCSDVANPMALQVANEKGVLLGRSSLRLRNPDNAGPAWVTSWLEEQGSRAAADTKGATMVAVNDSGESVVRVVSPLAIEAPCLVCHGHQEGRDPALAAVLAERYPQDKASGYALGDLRGAIWGEAPIDADHHAAHSAAPQDASLNPVQREMQALQAAMHATVNGIGQGNLDGVLASLHAVHGARQQTEAALESGAYHPPQNSEDIEGFVAMDEQFHDQLEPLIKAVQANDVAATAQRLGPVLASCDSCHGKYRFPTP